MTSRGLKSFWHYYGAKYRAAKHYPPPRHSTIIEPFAGAAGYSALYYQRNVILIEKYTRVAAIWDYLIHVSADEVLRIPEVEHVDDLPPWVPSPARDLVGFWMNSAATSPRKSLSAGRKRLAATGRKFEGWTLHTKQRIASQVDLIRHWKIIHGDWTSAPDIEATWFVDPPYNNKAGTHYVHSTVDYPRLARACQDDMQGQVIVCENAGADWLPLQTLRDTPAMNGRTSSEVIWTK